MPGEEDCKHRKKDIDPKSITIDQIDWFKLHVLSITYNRRLEPIGNALTASLEAAIENAVSAQASAGQALALKRWETASLIARTKLYFEFYGAQALDAAEAKYLVEEIIPDHPF